LKNEYITNLNGQVPVQKLKHAQRFLEPNGYQAVVLLIILNRKWAFHTSTGCNWL